MASSADRGKEHEGEGSRQAGRSQLEEAMEKLGRTEKEATPLVLEDDDAGVQKWMLAGKILFRHTFHIQTIASALRPAWGNPRGLEFRSVGGNLFVAEFESQRDRDRMKEGSPWHVKKNAVILEEFVNCMQPSELRFDQLQLWVRVLNLPFNLRTPSWGKAIAKQIDKDATQIAFDPVGGFLRARVTVDVTKPLRRELLCTTQGPRDAEGKLPYGAGLRAPDERKKSSSAEKSSWDQFHQNSKRETKFSSNSRATGVEVNSPENKNEGRKRKVDKKQVYQKVVVPRLPAIGAGDANANNQLVVVNTVPTVSNSIDRVEGESDETEPNKKRKTHSSSTNSAVVAMQPCQSQ
ncbi:hypothetical protein ACQ4PT_053028 [Festuca glaucescens]